MDKVKNHDGFSDKPFAKKAYDLWVNWKDNHSTDAQNDEKLGDDSVQKLKTHFK
jgi:hypothetical protein